MHEINTLKECIEYWASEDDWGVNNIYLTTLWGILKSFGIDVDKIYGED